MTQFSSGLAVLSAMITPAVLISACGSLILTTSQRLGRTIDRTRKLAEQFEHLAQVPPEVTLLEERRTVLFHLLSRTTRRTRLLQRAMTQLYVALSVFVGTSVTIAATEIAGSNLSWLPLGLGLIGAGLLLQASFLLIVESRVQLAAVDEEMDFVLRIGRHHAPPELLAERNAAQKWLRRPRL